MHERVSTGRGASIAGALLLMGAIAGASPGCALVAKPTMRTVPAVALSDLATFAQRVEQAGRIAEQAQQLEIGLYRLEYVPRETHLTIQQGC